VEPVTKLPADYRRQDEFEPTKRSGFILGSVGVGVFLLIAAGWLLIRLASVVRPGALDEFHGVLTVGPDGALSLTVPFRLILEAVLALILVVFAHELTHGLTIWWIAGDRPMFGIKGLLPYVAAPSGLYFPRNQFLIVGIAPLVLLTIVGLVLVVLAPAAAVPTLLMFVAFNASGAAGDVLMVLQILAYPPDALLGDSDTGMIIYVRGSSTAD